MADKNVIASMELARGYMLGILRGVSEEQMVVVPEGAKNNVLWNLGHLAQSHAGLVYGPCGLESPVPGHYAGLFKGGTSPSTWDEAPSVAEVKACFKDSHKQMMDDYRKGAFDSYAPYEMMKGVVIENVEQAIGFNIVHEGVHIGAIISICNLLGVSH